MGQSKHSEGLYLTNQRIGAYIVRLISKLSVAPLLYLLLDELKVDNSLQITIVTVIVLWVLLSILQKKVLIINSEGISYKKTFCGHTLRSLFMPWNEIREISYDYRMGRRHFWGDITVFHRFVESFYVGYYMTLAEHIFFSEQECEKIEKELVRLCKINRIKCTISRDYTKKPIVHAFDKIHRCR